MVSIELMNDFRNADGWTVRNLKDYRNSICDKQLIRWLGKETTERLLTVVMNQRVTIRDGRNGEYIAEVE